MQEFGRWFASEFLCSIPDVTKYNYYGDEDLFYTKRFLGIISNFVATKKTKISDLENLIGLAHTAKAGLCIPRV
jgi:hypothetical protein